MTKNNVFECKQCGQCCAGQGGIVLSETDITRLAEFLGLSRQSALEQWAVFSNGKFKIKSGSDGNCAFFTAALGCAVHTAKPDVCRAWPFFRGNLVDESSFALAKDYCPGIDAHCAFPEFVAQGLAYLDKSGILDHPRNANALMIERPLSDNLKQSGQG